MSINVQYSHGQQLALVILLTAAFNASAATLYVSLESTNPVAPYASWEMAATKIQDAVDAAGNGDTVLVTNGVYASGGRFHLDNNGNVAGNRVEITNSIKLESVNGPLATTIEGADYSQIRCVFLGGKSILNGFALTKGAPSGLDVNGNPIPLCGGGVFCMPAGIITNCFLTNNRGVGAASGGTLYNCYLSFNNGSGAANCTLYNCVLATNTSQGVGGGVRDCTAYNCTFTGNSAQTSGGAAQNSTLYNCILSGNAATDIGAAAASTLYSCTVCDNSSGVSGTVYNCIVYFNSSGNYEAGTALNYCCTTPLPTNGVGNFTEPPLFVNMAGGDFRLLVHSPCIDAGTNLVGLPVVPDGWDWDTLKPLFRAYTCEPTDIVGNTRFIDGNSDGIAAWDVGAYEFNSFKPSRFSSPPQFTATGWKLLLTGEPNKMLHVQKSNNLTDWEEIWSGLMPAGGVQQVTDGETGLSQKFYRAFVPE